MKRVVAVYVCITHYWDIPVKPSVFIYFQLKEMKIMIGVILVIYSNVLIKK